jgi:hypothetical protein
MTVLDHLRRVLFTRRDRFQWVIQREDDVGVITLALADERLICDRQGYIIGGDFYIPPEAFNRQFVPAGLRPTVARRQLAAAGALVVHDDGRYTVRQQGPDEEGTLHRIRCIRIRGGVMHTADGDHDDDGKEEAVVGARPNEFEFEEFDDDDE